MSRVGKLPVSIPSGVEVSVSSDLISVKGGGGVLTLALSPLVQVVSKDGSLIFGSVDDKSRKTNALVGTVRQLVNNMILGVSQGFEKKLSLVGVGFKAQASGSKLSLAVGYSHPVDIQMPAGIKVETPSPTDIVIKGADRQRVGQIAAEIRDVRPPEPYKGKGIRYSNERIVIKETKKK